jgi:hypothetical protein
MPATVIAVYELPEIEGAGGFNLSDFTRRRSWCVTLTEPAANGGELALAGSGIPAIGAAHPTLGGLLAARKGFRLDSDIRDGSVWVVSVDYEIPSASANADPWDREDRISFGEVRYEVPATVDKTSGTALAYKNAVGEPLAVTDTKINPVLVVNRFRKRTTFDPFAVYSLVNTLNSGSTTIRGATIAAKKALLLRFTVDDQTWSDGTTLYAIRMEIELEAQMVLETQRYQNKSFYCYTTASTHSTKTRVKCVVKNWTSGSPVAYSPPRDEPVVEPVFINADGTIMTTINEANIAAADIVRVRYAAAAWTALLA